MCKEMDSDKLLELCAAIERAWIDKHDRMVVEELCEKHPEFCDELQEFFADLLLEPSVASAEIHEAERQTFEWLTSTGLEIAKSAQSVARSNGLTTKITPATESRTEGSPFEVGHGKTSVHGAEVHGKTWVAFLRARTNHNLQSVVQRLANVTLQYLVLVGRHPNVVPVAVKRRIVEEVEKEWGVPAEESYSCLAQDPRLLRAASRHRPFEDAPKTFADLLERAALTNDQKQFWRGYVNSD
jgi:hypothetical protein